MFNCLPGAYANYVVYNKKGKTKVSKIVLYKYFTSIFSCLDLLTFCRYAVRLPIYITTNAGDVYI